MLNDVHIGLLFESIRLIEKSPDYATALGISIVFNVTLPAYDKP